MPLWFLKTPPVMHFVASGKWQPFGILLHSIYPTQLGTHSIQPNTGT